jgi:RNA polymerase sigma factor (TIGR02999 family)
MRRILIDYARRVGAEKRGGDRMRVTLSEEMAAEERDVLDVLALDEALALLESNDPRLARVAECRLFGGMSVPETAEALEVSASTVDRDWARARAYLHQLLAPEGGTS